MGKFVICHRVSNKALQGIIAIILVATLQLRGVPTAHAFDEEACTATYLQEKWVALDCAPGFATDRDRILVFVRDGVNPARPWQENINYTNAFWIFEAGAAGKASLIIDFHTDKGELVADLYDDENGDGMVKYTIKGGEPVVAEALIGELSRWTVRIVAKDGWWQRDGQVSFNLDIYVDGQVFAVYNYQFQGFDRLFKKDGIIDMVVNVRDPNHNGRPDYDWRQAYPPLPEDADVFRTTIMANTEDDELPMGEHVFWPYISPNLRSFEKDGYNLSFPPIIVDWNQAKVVGVSEFVTGRFNPGSYFIYSMERIREGQLTAANFENPFAFYDLAGAKDGYPDLAIRTEYWPPNDRWYDPGRFPYPISAVEYTWDQTHNHNWNYGITLLGKNGIDRVVEFPEFSVKTIPYQEYPYWVTEQNWDAAGFMQVEKPNYWTSEHIYEWGLFGNRALTYEYFPGRSDKPPDEYFQKIGAGFRGEYNLHYSEKPYLYFSPIDRKLHLLKAQRGVWIFIDGGREVRYENLGGQYLNKWSYLEGGVLKKSLYYASGHLILSDGQNVEIKRMAEPPSLFQTSPPRNSEEWQWLREQLERYKGNLDPSDFEGMVAQFEGEPISIAGGSVRDFRIAEGGFRFMLDLQPGFTASATEDGLWGALAEPQAYLVAYNEGSGFLIRPAMPAKFELGDDLPLVARQPIALEPVRLKVVARNKGDEDAQNITLRFYASDPSEEETLIGEVKTTLLAGEEKDISTLWAAPRGGQWTVSVRLDGEDGRVAVVNTDIVDVQTGPSGGLKLFSWGWGGLFGMALLLLILCGLAAAAYGLAFGSMEWQGGESKEARSAAEDERGMARD